jgi:hypothetical protein
MIQRLVTSNPSPGYVARVAAAFNDNGAGDVERLQRGVAPRSHQRRSGLLRGWGYRLLPQAAADPVTRW